MLAPNFQIKFCRLLKRAMSTLTGFPLLDEKNERYLRERLAKRTSADYDDYDKLTNDKVTTTGGSWSLSEELFEYTSIITSKSRYWTALLFGLINLLIVFKYWYHIFVLWRELDTYDFEQNVEFLEGVEYETGTSTGIGTDKAGRVLSHRTQPVVKFLCLLTNCTRLSDEIYQSDKVQSKLAEDLKYIPIFSLCHPNLVAIYSPVADLGSLSILMDYYISLLIFCTSVIYPVQQMLVNRANDESLMFIVAPNLTVEMLCDHLELMYHNYLRSLENFRQYLREKLPGRAYIINSIPYSTLFQRDILSPEGSSGDTTTTTTTSNQRRHLPGKRYLCTFKSYDRHVVPLAEHLGASSSMAPEAHISQSSSAVANRLFVRDCLPAVRTSWWRIKTAKLYFIAFVCYNIVICLPFIVFCMGIVLHKTEKLQVRLLAYDEFMTREKCAIWFNDEAADHHHQDNKFSRVFVKLADLDAGWTLWDIIETAPPITCSAYLIVILSTQIYIVICELACWLRELRQDLIMLTELVRVRQIVVLQERERHRLGERRVKSQKIPAETFCSRLSTAAPNGKTGMSLMRDLFIKHTRIRFGYVYTAPLGTLMSDSSQPSRSRGLRAKILQEQLALKMLQSTRDSNGLVPLVETTRLHLIELSQKLYLNYRLFIEFIELYSSKIAALILMANVGAYGSVIISFLLSKTTQDVLQYSNTLMGPQIFLTFVYISLVSNFHAESLKLQPLVWSLIAQLTEYVNDSANGNDDDDDENNVELKHMRKLITKQTVYIDRAGGLAISAFNFRVTYTNVIQIILWASTILVYALKDH